MLDYSDFVYSQPKQTSEVPFQRRFDLKKKNKKTILTLKYP